MAFSEKVEELYPEHLNPFGSDDDKDDDGNDKTILDDRVRKKAQAPAIDRNVGADKEEDEYPDYLSPFEADDAEEEVDDYDESLNPFGSHDEEEEKSRVSENARSEEEQPAGPGNPFEDADDDEEKELAKDEGRDEQLGDAPSISPVQSLSPPDLSLDPPPVPLPRTRSILKKELAARSKQQQLALALSTRHLPPQISSSSSSTSSSFSTTTTSTPSFSINTFNSPNATADANLSTSSSSSSAAITSNNNNNYQSTIQAFQKNKHKRQAPPAPIYFKRQVSGSLDAIDQELNGIGDQLAIIDEEFKLCQKNLVETHLTDDARFSKHSQDFTDIIKRKNSVVRRQKELMYRKRELALDQDYSDIEYELRMIGNKQMSHRTAEDDAREKELLKKLVEVVEERSDIVENLNKESSRRLNITKSDIEMNSTNDVVKNENCDKRRSLVESAKFSKIATLLHKSGTIKGTIKLKRKKLFKNKFSPSSKQQQQVSSENLE